MPATTQDAFIRTIRERCRVCYTCVRECPAKAIRIVNAQAEVMPERCIGCGNCVRVCSQNAKEVADAVGQVEALLGSGAGLAACVAPSFPAEFSDIQPEQFVGMVRSLGFHLVVEVAFGADLVADRYRRLLAQANGRRYIATTCPAIVEYVARYQPDLVQSLAPIVSPMVATSRVIRQLYDPDLKVVFIGPCVAKKQESANGHVCGDVDVALTFVELRRLFEKRQVSAYGVAPSDFDPPRAGTGALFPVSRGLLQSARIEEDLVAGEVVVADGRSNFVEAVEEFGTGTLDARLLEVLCCNGCIMGPGMSRRTPLFERRSRVSRHVRRRMASMDFRQWRLDMERFSGLDLGREFSANDQRIAQPSPQDLDAILVRLGKQKPQDELNCGACGYDTCREHAVAIHKGLAETEMCLPYTIDELRRTVGELARSNEQLASAQEALMQSEKLASMGQLAAGIAHEVNNPLGVVLMFAHLLLEQHRGGDSKLREDLTMIVEQADRCKKIVAGLLHFARQNKVVRQPVNVCELADRVRRALPPPPGVTVRTACACADPAAELDRDQIMQVLTNLVSNAYAAMPDGGTLTLEVSDTPQQVRFAVIDTGVGIPPEHMSRLFTPFFTTKQMGRGTGLGLAVTYGIVKMHRGDITVTSNADRTRPDVGTGSRFTVTLPRREDEG